MPSEPKNPDPVVEAVVEVIVEHLLERRKLPSLDHHPLDEIHWRIEIRYGLDAGKKDAA